VTRYLPWIIVFLLFLCLFHRMKQAEIELDNWEWWSTSEDIKERTI
jgi:hypothetical protein